VNGSDEFYSNIEKIKGLPSDQLGRKERSTLTGKRPVSGLSIAPDVFFRKVSKYMEINTLKIPYEEIFDRNERTLGATFAKFGDLSYYSPVQRIGRYM